ncbi:MAG: hypothetical protein J5546_04885 [Lachnospiraceae bacterium]|nr:hypothetical protein [Lachnospiraceae bacterium]
MFENENQLELQQEEERTCQRCRELGEKMHVVFVVNIVILILTVLLVATSASVIANPYGGSLGLAAFLLLLSAIGIIVCSIVYCVSVFQMGKYYDAFKTAGVLMLVAVILGALGNMTSGGLASLLSIASNIVKIFQLKYFIDGATDALIPTNTDVTSRWESLWKVYLITLVATLISSVGAYIPVINILAGIVAIICAIVSIIVGIWELILIKATSDALIYRSYGTESGQTE